MIYFDNFVKQTDKVGCIKRITQRTHLKQKTAKGLKWTKANFELFTLIQ